MADLYKTLYQGQPTASITTLATVGAGKAWIVKHWTARNNDSAARTLTLYKNGSAAANILTPAVSIPAGGMVEWDGTMALGDGDTLRGVASAASQVTLTVDGDEVS